MPTSLERDSRFLQPQRVLDENFQAIALFSALGLIITCAVISLAGAELAPLVVPIE
jgi:hypothetical protein